MKIIDYEKVRSYSVEEFEKRFVLYQKFLNYLGNPQKRLKTVIITGSTGKGSTAGYLASILNVYKIKTGLYTSPHILKVNERIMVNNQPILSGKIKSIQKYILNEVSKFNKKYNENYIPTFFELHTLTAFYYFVEKKVEIAILEVGLGGRLDATNVTSPVLNIITPVCKDHTNFLGDSLKSIAKEKSMVIKENSYTIVSKNEREVIKVLKKRCKETGSKIFFQGKDFKYFIKGVKNNSICFEYSDAQDRFNFEISDISTGAVNSISIALFSAKILFEKVLQKEFNYENIKSALENFKILCRFQKIKYKNKIVILDGAHNRISAEELVNTIKLYNYTDLNIIFSILCDKEVEEVLKNLKSLSKKIIIVKMDNPRTADIIEVYNIAKKYFLNIILMNTLSDAIKYCISQREKYILITGSFYLCSEFLQKYENKDW